MCLTVPGVSGLRSPWRDAWRTKAVSSASQEAGVTAAMAVPPSVGSMYVRSSRSYSSTVPCLSFPCATFNPWASSQPRA
ncbi:Uncharacterised protein [Mycobacteroides abscessus subsp. abscessus]|nr:Uncharacterised protein [Mycobacteroides abscessus subsp. abscessus]